ncbi:G-X-X-X-Q-X-W domain-containing protein [Ephemerocybe angulata]|uniref:G-X-X-X-Q-X-W domain-containing protein n=1 Tax=Ephemerocybe angulata TaxID=980116 RepID=A0A8H6HHV9_9AGAR|nr:G-X-X-X-Q-X-W domain-containing protein [Tulosesus angulatus]
MILTTIHSISLLLLSSISLTSAIIEKRQSGYATQFIIRNSCPGPVQFYAGSSMEATLQPGDTHTRFGYNYTDLFFTDANGGNANGAGTTRAGFFDNGYYYITKDDTGPLNTGMSIVPRAEPHDGFCVPITCDASNCTTAFNYVPYKFPPVLDTAPTPPYYRCPTLNTTYEVTFCPSGAWPSSDSTWTIHPGYSGQNTKCLDVRGGTLENGTPVQIYECNGSAAQNWQLVRGSTKVKLGGTNFCLDAGSSPANGVGLKIWQCYDNLPAQQWYFTDDNRIALEGQGMQCRT